MISYEILFLAAEFNTWVTLVVRNKSSSLQEASDEAEHGDLVQLQHVKSVLVQLEHVKNVVHLLPLVFDLVQLELVKSVANLV